MRLVEKWSNVIWPLLDQLRGTLNTIDAIDTLMETLTIKIIIAYVKAGKDNILESLAIEVSELKKAIEGKDMSEQILVVMTYLEQTTLLKGVFTSLQDKKIVKEVASKLGEISFEEAIENSEAISELFLGLVEKRDQAVRGEGFTPISIRKLVSGLLSQETFTEVYDPVIGSGSLAVQVALDNKVEFIYGQDISKEVLRYCKILLIAGGRLDSIKNIKSGDTLLEPAHLENNKVKQRETIVAVPPMGFAALYKENIMDHSYERFSEEVLNLRASDMLFVSHIVSSLKDQGRAVVLVNNGVLFRQGAEANIRRQFLDEKIIECIIQLPGKMLTNTAIPTSLVIFNKKKINETILFMDLTNEVSKISKLTTVLSDKTIHKACEIYHKQLDTVISKNVAVSEVIKNDCNLTVNRYFELQEEEIDLDEVNTKIHELQKELLSIQTAIENILG